MAAAPTNQTAITPAPCPFCGRREIRTDSDGEGCWIFCKHCHATGPWATLEEDTQRAITLWNQRATRV